MILKECEIENLRCFERVSVRLGRFNVVLGANNSGKSNLLEALHRVLNPWTDPEKIGYTREDFFDPEKPIRINLTLGSADPQDHAAFTDWFETLEGEEVVRIRFECRYNPEEEMSTGSLYFAKHDNQDEKPSYRQRNYVCIFLRKAGVNPLEEMRTTSRTWLGKMLRSIDISSRKDEITKSLSQAADTLGEIPDIRDLESRISTHLDKVIPLERDGFKFTVSSLEPDRILRGIQVYVRTRGSQSRFHVERQGLGTQDSLLTSMFRVYVDHAMRQGCPILAIEEPEAHLHPHIQRTLRSENSRSPTQTILTTHSPFFIQGMDPAQIIILRNIGGKATASQLAEDDFTPQDRSRFEKYFDVGRSEVFFSNAALLVEGPTETGAFPPLSARVVEGGEPCDFDKHSISVLGEEGAGTMPLLSGLLSKFRIPHIAVLDTHPGDTDQQRKLAELSKTCQKVIQLDSDFEGTVASQCPISPLLFTLSELLDPKDWPNLQSDWQSAAGTYLTRDHIEQIEIRPEQEAEARKVVAKWLRKRKGHLAGRLLASNLQEADIPTKLREAITETQRLALSR